MRLRFAVAILAFPLAAAAQSASVVLPGTVFTAVPFMVDVAMDCPPPGEAAPPPGCRGSTGIWFEVSEPSAFFPHGLYALSPFSGARLGPFTFHKPGRHSISVFGFSREFPGEIELLAESLFVVAHPTPDARRRQAPSR
jgi:hypothetical protein